MNLRDRSHQITNDSANLGQVPVRSCAEGLNSEMLLALLMLALEALRSYLTHSRWKTLCCYDGK